ncbi:MAG: T9SS type A sorting domain-containing protein, partial [Bacteroidales bacterium]|nr:T9SS type A sorting domain-containing protein [Bacteroidales bacterium]
MKKIYITLLSVFVTFNIWAQVTIYESGGWLESVYALWAPVSNATSYNVYYSGEGITDQKIDNTLIRNYGGYYRADVLGLKEGSYTLKIVAVQNGVESTENTATTSTLNVQSHIREGFAFSDGSIPGAYNSDGTLNDGADVLYIDNTTAKTVTLDIVIDNKGNTQTVTGIGNILAIKGKGYDRTPLSVRFIGKVIKDSIDIIKDNKYLDLQGSKSLIDAQENDKGPLFNTTLEGVGDDATLYGYGINLKRTAYIEIRNLAFMLWGGGSDGDAVSMDTDNKYIWVHNNDFFYGEPGGDADQVKGDGSIDMKYNSSNITISFNHFWDSGKVMGCGGATGEDNQLLITFHHNWFDHSDSRMPRLTYTNAHVYNNYYDGVGTYGIGTSRFSSAFIENNYFRGTYRPMLIPGQGTDVWEGGTDFSGSSFTSQDGGMAKAYNNSMNGGTAQNDLSYFNQNTTPVAGQIDAFEVTDPATSVPNTVAALLGGYTYNNFDTDVAMYNYSAETPDVAKATVLNLAGRLNGGDFKYTFNNSIEDDNKSIITELNQALIKYETYNGAYQGGTNGIINTTVTNLISLYPNPVEEILNILSDIPVCEVKIYSYNGKLVSHLSGKIQTINMESLNTGIYIIKVST